MFGLQHGSVGSDYHPSRNYDILLMSSFIYKDIVVIFCFDIEKNIYIMHSNMKKNTKPVHVVLLYFLIYINAKFT